jgi:hypothetical protein
VARSTRKNSRSVAAFSVIDPSCWISASPPSGWRNRRQRNVIKAWAVRLLERKRPNVVAVELANKTARIAWALSARGTGYAAPSA